MDFAVLIMTGVLIVTLASPIFTYYAIKQARLGNYAQHKKLQTWIFAVSVSAVLLLEGLIRFAGGSGSLTQHSSHVGTTLFTSILIAHIIGAVLTYLLWIYLVVVSNKKFNKTLPGNFSVSHKKLGIIVFVGLIYTGITALIVYLMTLDLV